jgi:ribosomal protein S18 acetylase RimI-like enzyme
MGREIVGWCSIIPGSPGKHFVHQLGVTPKARRCGLAKSLLMHLVNKLKSETTRPEIEFTIDRRNRAAFGLVTTVAGETGMHLWKLPEPVGLLEEGSAENLYVMTSVANRRANFSNEVANDLWTPMERTEATVTNGLSS